MGRTFATFKSFFKRSRQQCTEALFPGVCCHCGKLFRLRKSVWHGVQAGADPPKSQFAELMAADLCQGCIAHFKQIQAPLCSCCGQPFAASNGVNHLCAACESWSKHYRQARSVAAYDPVLRSLIRHLKYHGRIHLAVPLGYLLWQSVVSNWEPSSFDGIIPVPLHVGRLRQRGFNQSELLTRRWISYALQGGMVMDRSWIAESVLVRKYHTQSQTGLNKQQRRDNLKSAFWVARPELVENKRWLIVDDVMTTGATIEACARILMSAGAARVDAITLARVVLPIG